MKKMKKLISIAALLVLLISVVPTRAGSPAHGDDAVTKTADIFTVSDAFVRLPAKTLDLLSTSMRKDLLDYYRNDSICKVRNTMEGESYLIAPITDNYLQVCLTPVTVLTMRLLPSKKGPVVMTLYTTGDSLQAHDTEICFYDMRMKELKREKIIKPVSPEHFINTGNRDRHEREELCSLIPFTTVEYSMPATGDTLTARLTAGEYLGRETMEKLTPHLISERQYVWNGSKFKLVKQR